MYVSRIIAARSCNNYCNGKLGIFTYSEFLTLGIQHAMHIHHIICGLSYFSTLSHRQHYYRKKKAVENKTYFGFLYDFA